MKCISLKETQGLLFDLLTVWDQIAAEHSLRYSLDGGTLLGAVRHKGFIPWDDDIDLLVPRPDYQKLIDHPEWVPDGYQLIVTGENSFHPYLKLVNLSWRAQEDLLKGVYEEYLWIDLFPADAIPDDEAAERALIKTQSSLSLKAFRAAANSSAAVSNKGRIASIIKKTGYWLYGIAYSPMNLSRKLESNAKALDYGSTKYVGNIVWGFNPKQAIKAKYPVEDFDSLIKLEFEGSSFSVAPHWNEYLTSLYGDYMKLPPEEERVCHGAKVWHV